MKGRCGTEVGAEGDGATLWTQDPAAVDMHHLARDPITGG